MELRHLRYFVAVAEEKNFTRAAERLAMQQPPLSQQIRALEQELGFDLFHRNSKGVALTASGAVFLEDAKAILEDVNRATVRAGRADDGSEGSLALGLTSSAATHPLVAQILRAYHRDWPNVALDFIEGNAAELSEAIVSRKVDAAFVRLPVAHPTGVVFRSLQEEELRLILPIDHRLLKGHIDNSCPSLKLDLLKDEPFILVRRHGAPGMYSNLLEACRNAGFTPKVAFEVDRMLTNINLVAAGLGVSAVPASMTGIQAKSVAYCRISDPDIKLGAPLTIAHHVANMSPALRNFQKIVDRVIDEGEKKHA